MSKTPPKPPVTDPASPYESFNSKKLHEAAERALDHYLVPAQIMATPYIPNNLFMVNPQSDTESLLVNACESLASATVMLGDFAALLEGTHRKLCRVAFALMKNQSQYQPNLRLQGCPAT